MASLDERVTFDLSVEPSARANYQKYSPINLVDVSSDRAAEETLLQKSKKLILELQDEITIMRDENTRLQLRVEGLLDEIQANTRVKLKNQEECRKSSTEYDELIDSKYIN